MVTKNNIAWKLVRSYCLCYCKTFFASARLHRVHKNVFNEVCSTLFVTPKIKYYYRPKENPQYGKILLAMIDFV